MSQENLELVRAAERTFNSGDLDAWLQLLDRDIEWHVAEEDPEQTIYHGREGVRRYVSEWLEILGEIHVEATELLDAGDEVFAWVHFTGRGASSGATVEMYVGQVWTFKDGSPVRVREFLNREKGLAAITVGQAASMIRRCAGIH